MQKTIDSQHSTICQINRTSQGQLKEIRALKRLPKNSGNSSNPPLKGQMKNEIVRRTKSLRKPSGKKPGGQPGHDDNTLELRGSADSIMEESADICDICDACSLERCDMGA